MAASRNSPCPKTFPFAQLSPRLILAAAISLVILQSPIGAEAAGNATEGRQLYQNFCVGCHGDEKMSPPVGPRLNGVYGRKAAIGDSGVHSSALMDANITWNDATLRKYLAAPTKQVPGSYMPVGFPDPKQLDDLIAYLRTLR